MLVLKSGRYTELFELYPTYSGVLSFNLLTAQYLTSQYDNRYLLHVLTWIALLLDSMSVTYYVKNYKRV